MRFDGMVALITGGTGALGRYITKAFLEEGARVAASYIVESEADETKALVAVPVSSLRLYRADVTDEAEVRRLMADVVRDHGTIDILVNVVGGYLGGIPVREMSLRDWEFMMALNLRSAFLCCREVVPVMERGGGGKIVNVASRSGLAGEEGHSAYSASKAGVIRLTETLSEEVKEAGINVNCILPSIIDTPANRKAMPRANHQMWPKPLEVARVVLFLASEDAGLLHGAAVPVYGLS